MCFQDVLTDTTAVVVERGTVGVGLRVDSRATLAGTLAVICGIIITVKGGLRCRLQVGVAADYAGGSGVQSLEVDGLLINVLNDVNLTTGRVIREIDRPAGLGSASRRGVGMAVSETGTYKAGQIPQALPGMCAISAMKRPLS